MNENIFDSWEEFLNPNKLKINLIKASIYLTAYEIFKNGTVEKLREFFTSSWSINKETGEFEGKPSPNYKKKVLSLNPRDEFDSCILWFRNMEALNDNDITDIAIIRKHRNLIAHELPNFLSGQEHSVSLTNLNTLNALQHKIDRWWIKEIEIPTNPDIDVESFKNIDLESSFGSNTLLMNLLSSIFNGDDSYLRDIHKKFVELWRNTV